uniref:Ovule protein n=1 Tax=Bursaphelenchus xylophilus TaxID=6326 RepID=A0A1I7RQE9_BURXY
MFKVRGSVKDGWRSVKKEFESRCSQTARLYHEDSLKPEECSISSKVNAALTFQLFPGLMSHQKGLDVFAP